MGWFQNAFKNEVYDTPAKNPGLSREPDKVTATNTDNGKSV